MTVYTSGPIKVGPLKDRTESLSRVDVVFYGIDHSGPSFEARIFLDNPGADASTPMDADHGFAGTFHIFGHGGCFGDEGHCEVPTGPVSAFDRRPPHQLTPTIKRVIATAAVKRVLQLSDQGTMSVTVVPIVKESPLAKPEFAEDVLSISDVAILAYR